MDRATKIIGLLAGIIAILEFVLRLTNPQALTFLIGPLFSVSLLHLVLAALVLLLAYRMLPSRLARHRRLRRAKVFEENWHVFKQLLVSYQQTRDNSLQGRYHAIRRDLVRDYEYFLPQMHRIDRLLQKQFPGVGIANLGRCISVNHIGSWETEVQRLLPDEVDCFDSYFISLQEHIDA